MAVMQIREALRAAIDEEMARDDRVFVMGEEVGHYEGAYKVTQGLLAKYGEQRVVDTPIAEAGFAGVGIGAAMAGLRPIIEFMTFNFSAVAFDQLLNNAPKLRQLSAGQFKVPIVFRGPNAAAHMLSSTHSQAFESFYCGFPGVKVISVATPYDAKGLLKSAIRDDNPVIFFEAEIMYAVKGEVPDEEYLIPIGEADIKRPGEDVTVITWGQGVPVALKAAELAEAEHIAASTRINEGFMQSDVTKLEEGLAALDEAALEQEIAALHETLRGEYETLVTRMIEREHVHLTLDVRQEGVTRFVDDEAIPRCAQLRHREIGMDTFAIGRLFGRMIGLRTGGGLPPAFEYRPLVDALAAHGDLVVHDVRRPK